MPVIVTPDKYNAWLDTDVTDLDAIRDIFQAIRRRLDASLSG
jgi:hypothetical protein